VSALGLGIPCLGIVTPLGSSAAEVVGALFAGSRHGLVGRDNLLPGRTVHVGAVTSELPPVPEHLSHLDCRNNRLAQAALAQIVEPVEGLARKYGRHRIAVVMGTSTSGIGEAENAYVVYRGTGAWPKGYRYSQQEPGNLAQFVAKALKLDGPAYAVGTACTSSAKAIAAGRRLIRAGLVDAAVVGGVDSLCRTTIGGFASLEAMSPGLCNPFSLNRNGLNIGETAAILVLTREPFEIVLVGTGETSDAHHISAPDPEGRGARRAIEAALDDAGLAPDDIAYVNLHGTGTQLNDLVEGKVTHAVFGSRVPCSSTKALTGHTLGAAGACEAAFLWLTLSRTWNAERRLPPHVWDGVTDPAIPKLAFVERTTRFAARRGGEAMLSSSFAFGGSNTALVLARRELA